METLFECQFFATLCYIPIFDKLVLNAIYPHCWKESKLVNNYWMRLSMISRIIQTEVNVICRSRRLRRITLTEVWIILDIMRKPNPIIVLLYIQNSDRCKKKFAVKRLGRLTFRTAARHFRCFVIFAALRLLRHQRPIIFFLDSSVE